MKVILLDNIRGIGHAGDVKEVNDGYARNFLMPRKLARPASAGTLKEAESQQRSRREAASMAHSRAEHIAADLDGTTVVMSGKANDKGTLFKAISERDIADVLSRQTGLPINAPSVILDGHLKHTGTHSVRLRLSDDMIAEITVRIDPQ